VAGSYIDRCRLALSTGNTLADGWFEPFLQSSGLFGCRIRAAAQTRPFSSIIWLCVLDWLSQIDPVPVGRGCHRIGPMGGRIRIAYRILHLRRRVRQGIEDRPVIVLFSGAP